MFSNHPDVASNPYDVFLMWNPQGEFLKNIQGHFSIVWNEGLLFKMTKSMTSHTNSFKPLS